MAAEVNFAILSGALPKDGVIGSPLPAHANRADCRREVLGYTATSDSAGSLGGIVAQGDPTRLDATLSSALHRARWCSNDPLYMESEASGADSLNLAACHACVLLRETSCENNNILLDRATLIGTPDRSVPGFFGGTGTQF